MDPNYREPDSDIIARIEARLYEPPEEIEDLKDEPVSLTEPYDAAGDR